MVLVAASTAHSLRASENDPRQVQVAAAVEAQMQEHQVPGVSVAVIDKYEVLWAAGFGVRRADGPDPVTGDTLFQAASISKPITALAALKLVEAGRLNLDAPVNDALQSWQIPQGEVTRDSPILLRQLLSHSGGLSVHGFMGYATTANRPTLLELLDGKKPANSGAVKPFLKPGLKFQYSGGGYCVLQQLLIDISGQPFPDFMRQTVLSPEGMTSSTFEQPLPESLADRAAAGHQKNQKVIAGNWRVHPEMAAAGLWTTPHDLSLAAIDVARSYAHGDGKLLSQAMARQMLTRENEAMGLGFVVTGEGDRLAFSHSGGNVGYRCRLVCYPATGQGLVIMTNSDTGAAILAPVIDAAREAYAWPADEKGS